MTNEEKARQRTHDLALDLYARLSSGGHRESLEMMDHIFAAFEAERAHEREKILAIIDADIADAREYLIGAREGMKSNFPWDPAQPEHWVDGVFWLEARARPNVAAIYALQGLRERIVLTEGEANEGDSNAGL